MKTKNASRPLLLTFYDTFISKFKNKEDKCIFKFKKNFTLKTYYRRNKKMAKKPAVEALFVKSKVREYIKGKGCNTSGGLIDGPTLNDAIIDVLDNAIRRAKANGRKTVQEKDL